MLSSQEAAVWPTRDLLLLLASASARARTSLRCALNVAQLFRGEAFAFKFEYWGVRPLRSNVGASGLLRFEFLWVGGITRPSTAQVLEFHQTACYRRS